MVDVEHGNRGPATRRLTDKNGAEPFKVAIPALATGIEEPNNLPRERISAAQVWPLPEIAPVATPAAVVRSIHAAIMLFSWRLHSSGPTSRLLKAVAAAYLPCYCSPL